MDTTAPVRSVLFLTPFLDDNSTGRTYSLWLLAKSLGWDATVISFHGEDVWGPLSGTEFAAACHRVRLTSRSAQVDYLLEEAQKYDAVVAVKPLRQSLGLALSALKKRPFPLVVDIDDPDLEARLAWKPLWRALLWRLRYFRFWTSVRGKGRLARRATIMVSNPTLEARYGGIIVPHARLDDIAIHAHTSDTPTIAFVGTARAHKGIDVLREATKAVADEGFTLTITDEAPADAAPWENWIGNVPFERGLQIVSESDIVAIPSKRNANSIGQLPVKLVDAMMLERAVVVTDVDPLPWAVGELGVVVPHEDAEAMAEQLLLLKDPSVRAKLGAEMRRRALEIFAVTSISPSFARAIETSIAKKP
ncbi:glycosyltransferase family 4 protein [Herbiconiux sp. 11R-BC]|uniref:glycosyltransferase family 4 protein n=1 Tax=Herbiconiux sp. 11R-BC TaxID=3111637 RepID=UPI003C05A2E9